MGLIYNAIQKKDHLAIGVRMDTIEETHGNWLNFKIYNGQIKSEKDVLKEKEKFMY